MMANSGRNGQLKFQECGIIYGTNKRLDLLLKTTTPQIDNLDIHIIRMQDIGDGVALAGYATTLSVVGAEVGVPMSVIDNTISSVGSAGELVLDFANGDMGDGLKGAAFRLLEKGTEKVLNKFLPGFGKKIGEEGFNLGTEIIDQGRKLKQSGVERLTDIVIEKKSKKITKVRIKMNNVWYIYCGGVYFLLVVHLFSFS